MKYFTILFLIFSSCNNFQSGPNGDKIPLGNRTIQVVEFDGCEYLYIRRYESISITHKGNCKNND